MSTSTKLIQKLRQQTGAGIMDVKKALEQSNNDKTNALKILQKMSQELANKKQATRETKDGTIGTYLHTNSKIAALVMLCSETDFVAKNQEFKKLAYDIAMQVAAMDPKDISSLLNQNFIKDESKTIQDIINNSIAKLGEKIEIKEIKRMCI